MFKRYLQLISEDINTIDKVVTYQGRFGPPTKAHIYVYYELCNEFGQQNVYVLTADPKVLDEKNPFTFQQKKEMLIAAGIPESNIKQMKGSAYKWESIANSINIMSPEETAVIAAMGAKDADERLKGGKYYLKYLPGIPLNSMTKNGYVKIIANMNVGDSDVPVSASSVREAIKNKDINIIKQTVLPGVFDWLQKEGII